MALNRGFLPTMIGIIPYAGTSFTTYETLKGRWEEKSNGEKLPKSKHLMFGAIAGLLGQFVSYPLDIVRRRMQTASQMGIDAKRYSSIIGTLKVILR